MRRISASVTLGNGEKAMILPSYLKGERKKFAVKDLVLLLLYYMRRAKEGGKKCTIFSHIQHNIQYTYNKYAYAVAIGKKMCT